MGQQSAGGDREVPELKGQAGAPVQTRAENKNHLPSPAPQPPQPWEGLAPRPPAWLTRGAAAAARLDPPGQTLPEHRGEWLLPKSLGHATLALTAGQGPQPTHSRHDGLNPTYPQCCSRCRATRTRRGEGIWELLHPSSRGQAPGAWSQCTDTGLASPYI